MNKENYELNNHNMTIKEYSDTFEIKNLNCSNNQSDSSMDDNYDDDEMKTKLIEYIKDNSLREILLLLKGEPGQKGDPGHDGNIGKQGKRGRKGDIGYPPVSVLREIIREEIINLKKEDLL